MVDTAGTIPGYLQMAVASRLKVHDLSRELLASGTVGGQFSDA